MPDFFRKTKQKKQSGEKWFELEGELVIDMYQTEKDLVIQSAIAGVRVEDLDIHIEEDKVTIKGKREGPVEEGKKTHFYQECYWGPFYREIILPKEIDPAKAKATFKEGIFTLRMPLKKDKEKDVKVKTE
jgi:HSP20 family protein